jgi:hypothetical protein
VNGDVVLFFNFHPALPQPQRELRFSLESDAMKRPSLFLGALALVLACSLPVRAGELIVNGGFEAGGGSLAGWTVADQANGSGTWFLQSGTSSPLGNATVPPPPGPTHAAMTDQTGPGSHVLFQNFVVPFGVTSASLSFQYFINNQNGTFFSPATLDFNASPNQQARVDIMTTTSDPFSVAAGDVLQNIYQTNPGDPATSGYSPVVTDVTALLQAHQGQTLRLRFAETDDQFFFENGVDNVSLQAQAAPEPGSLALLGMAGATAASYLGWRRRKKSQPA